MRLKLQLIDQQNPPVVAGFAFQRVVRTPFLNPLSPAMKVSSMCGISVMVSTISP